MQMYTQMLHSNVTLKCYTQMLHSNVTLRCYTQMLYSNVILKYYTQILHSNVTLKRERSGIFISCPAFILCYYPRPLCPIHTAYLNIISTHYAHRQHNLDLCQQLGHLVTQRTGIKAGFMNVLCVYYQYVMLQLHYTVWWLTIMMFCFKLHPALQSVCTNRFEPSESSYSSSYTNCPYPYIQWNPTPIWTNERILTLRKTWDAIHLLVPMSLSHQNPPVAPPAANIVHIWIINIILLLLQLLTLSIFCAFNRGSMKQTHLIIPHYTGLPLHGKHTELKWRNSIQVIMVHALQISWWEQTGAAFTILNSCVV